MPITNPTSLDEIYRYIVTVNLGQANPTDITLSNLLLAMGQAIESFSGGGTVSSVFTRTGAVVANTGDYTVSQVTGAAPLANPTFTGTPAAPTATGGTNTTQLATTAFVQAALPTLPLSVANGGSGVGTFTAGIVTASGTSNFATVAAPSGTVVGTTDSQTLTNKSLTSPSLTGTPTSPTAAIGTNTTQVATTAFVQQGAPVNILTTSFTSNAYTLALADNFSAQQASNGSTAATVTVPLNATVAFPVGSVITFTQTGSGKIQIAAAGGVTIISSVSGGFVSGTTGCRAQNSTIGLLKTATNSWTLSGDAA